MTKIISNSIVNFCTMPIPNEHRRIAAFKVKASPAPCIRAMMPDSAPFPHSNIGRVIGCGEDVVLLAKIEPSCLIDIAAACPESSTGFYIHRFRIEPDFHVVPFSSSPCRENSESRPMIRNHPAPPGDPLDVNNDDLRRIFAQHSPSWMHEILCRQLEHWRVHEVARFFEFTPGPLEDHDIQRCVKASVHVALARWSHRLQPHQLEFCFRKGPLAAMYAAFEHLTPGMKKNLAVRFPKELLEYAAASLSTDLLTYCVRAAPGYALELRFSPPPEVGSRILAAYCRTAGYRTKRKLPRGLDSEIWESITKFPAIWLASYDGSFQKMMADLEHKLAIRPKAHELFRMAERIDVVFQKDVCEHIASMI